MSKPAAADDGTLASGAYDGTVRLWSTTTHRLDAILNGHGGRVYSVTFSQNDQILAGGGADGTVRLWDVATRQQIGDPLGADTGAVFSVAFSPDGKTLASGDAHKVRLSEMGDLVYTASRLCNSRQGPLTRAE